MKALIQRVNKAILSVDGKMISAIDQGLVCYLGIGREDSDKELKWLVKKIAGLRILPDADGKMNLSLLDTGFEIMVVSQFTLFGDIKSGYRPSFSRAEAPAVAEKKYEQFCEELIISGIKKVARGVFGGDMTIEQCNCGPVSILIDTAERKF